MPVEPSDIDLNKRTVRDFSRIAMHVDAFPRIREVANRVGPQPGLARLAEVVARETHLPTSHVRDLIRGLVSLRASANFFKAEVADFIEAVTQAFVIKDSTDEDEKRTLKIWIEKKDRILAAVQSLRAEDEFLTSEKAGRIAFARQKILKEAQILTDLRPVFNEEATAISNVIITHSLLLEYRNGSELQKIELTLDAADVSALKRTCIRAEQKAITAKESLKAMPWKTIVFNEWHNEGPVGPETPK